MDDKTHFQINPARYKHLSPSGSTGNENVYTQRQKARRLLWSVCLFNVAARVAFCRSRLVQSCRLRRERSVERLYHIFRLLSLFFFLIMLSIFLADTADAAFGTTTVDGAGSADMGQYSSIAVGTSGAAYISYYNDGTADDLMYATNVSGSFGTTTVDSTGITGLWTSIAVGTSGAAYISYYDSSNSALKYATNVSGSFVTTTVDNTTITGEYTSIAVGSSGAVYISYYDSGANHHPLYSTMTKRIL